MLPRIGPVSTRMTSKFCLASLISRRSAPGESVLAWWPRAAPTGRIDTSAMSVVRTYGSSERSVIASSTPSEAWTFMRLVRPPPTRSQSISSVRVPQAA